MAVRGTVCDDVESGKNDSEKKKMGCPYKLLNGHDVNIGLRGECRAQKLGKLPQHIRSSKEGVGNA